MTKTVHTLESTGTKHGIHNLVELAYGCPRRAYYKARDARDYDACGAEKEYKSEALLTGVLWHAYRELENSSRLIRDPVPDVQDIEFQLPHGSICDPELWCKCVDTATRMEAAYREVHKGLGYKILAVEQHVGLEAFQDNMTPLPVPYTGRVDLVIQLTKLQAKNLSDKLFLRLHPGVYLVDYKSMGRADPITIAKTATSLQGLAYLEAYNHGRPPRKRAQGMLYIFGTRTKNPSFMYAIQRYDSRQAMRRLGALATEVYALWPLDDYMVRVDRGSAPLPKCNPERCYDWHRQCVYGYLGECEKV